MIDNLYVVNPDILLEDIIKEYLGLDDIKSRELETLNRLCQFLKVENFYHHIFDIFMNSLNFKLQILINYILIIILK